MGMTRERQDKILDAYDPLCRFRINIDILNECFGTNKTHYFMAAYPQKKGELFEGINNNDKYFVWMPKLYGNSSLWDNGISSDQELIYEIAEPERTKDWMDEEKHDVNALRIVFAKPDKKSPYQFVGVFLMVNKDYCHHLYIRVSTKIRLIGHPVYGIELINDYRKDSEGIFKMFSALTKYYKLNFSIKLDVSHNRMILGKFESSNALFSICSKVGWALLYYNKNEKNIIDLLNIDSKVVNNDEPYDYCCRVAYSDFDRVIKAISIYLGNIEIESPILDTKKFVTPLSDDSFEVKENKKIDDEYEDELKRSSLSNVESYFEYEEISPKTKEIVDMECKTSVAIYKRDPKIAKNALAHARYKCEYDPNHSTFLRKNSDKPYTESHHLIPMQYSEQFKYSLDTEVNIVSLCSNCHNRIHYGKDADLLIKKLYRDRMEYLEKAGIGILEENLLLLYGFDIES